jgi:hypothetical protein
MRLTSSRLSIALVLTFAPLAAAAGAHAGQLHIDSFGLHEVHASGGSAVHGTVVSLKEAVKRDPVLELKVTRVFVGTDGAWRDAKPGDVLAIHLDPGVEWTDPRKSPIERRVYGQLDAAKAGDVVLVVGGVGDSQMLAATPATLRAATVLFDADARARYAKEPRATLENDLSDDHLVLLALDALKPQGGPSARGLLSLRWSLRYDAYGALDTAARKRFLTDAIAVAKTDRKARDALVGIAVDRVDPATLDEVARVAALLDAKSDDSHVATLHANLAKFAADPARTVDLSPMAPFVVTYYVNRPRYRATDTDLPRITSRMSPKARALVAKELLAAVHTSSEADDGVDGFLLDEAVRLLVDAPDASALPALAKVDPSRERTTSAQEYVLGAIQRIATAIADASPPAAAEAKRIVAAAQQRVPEATMPPLPPRGPFVEETMTLAPGKSHALKSGAVLNHLRDPPVLTTDCPDGGGSLSYTTKSGYREWWSCGYLFHVNDAKPKGSLAVRAVPVAIPPAPMDFGDAQALAEKALAGRGCTSGSSTEQDADTGWMQYESATDKGKKCRVLMGKYSRSVVRIEGP